MDVSLVAYGRVGVSRTLQSQGQIRRAKRPSDNDSDEQVAASWYPLPGHAVLQKQGQASGLQEVLVVFLSGCRRRMVRVSPPFPWSALETHIGE